jgi:protein ImuB
VLVETVGNRQIVVHVSPEAMSQIYPGMALTEARARQSALLDFPATPAADLRSLTALGHWLMRFSPNVCVSPPALIFLDATGLGRLFGGLHNLCRRVAEALASLRITASVALAPTAGSAWAIAAFREETQRRRSPRRPRDEETKCGGKETCACSTSSLRLSVSSFLPSSLFSLPPEALRLEPETIRLLSAFGVRTIHSLLQLPRVDLAIRFGPAILTRIDQALGAAPEPLTYLVHRSPIQATLEFEGAIESLDAIHFAVQELIAQVTSQLAARGLGARELRLAFRQPYAQPIEKLIRLMRPCRNKSALMKLTTCALENLEATEGFVAVSLAVPTAERLGDEQAALIGGEEEQDAAELDHLVERLRAKLDRSIEWGELIESNLPENSSRCADAPHKAKIRTEHSAVDLLRPLRLLRQPRSIAVIVRPSESRDGFPASFTDRGEVHRLDHIRGPERITGQWWLGRSKTRDYFDVLDAAGDRYWIFRVAQTGRWFLHGIFG